MFLWKNRFGALAVALLAALTPSISVGADHRDSPRLMSNITFEGNLDLNDTYLFLSPSVKDRTVIITTFSPAAGVVGPSTFRPYVAYEIRIQNTAAVADNIVFEFTFSVPDAYGRQNFQLIKRTAKNGGPLVTTAGQIPASGIQQQVLAFGATGYQVAVKGGGKVMTGIFDDPFFFDSLAFNKFESIALTGAPLAARVAPFLPPNIPNNFFANFNTLAIILELPTETLTSKGSTKFGFWARTLAPGDQIDREGNPAINTATIPPSLKNVFNIGSPFFDVQQYGAIQTSFISQIYGVSPAYAAGLTSVLLPDLLRIDVSKPTAFPNGRKLTDDVIDTEFALLTNGALKSDRVDNDSVFSNKFPYLGPPQPRAPLH